MRLALAGWLGLASLGILGTSATVRAAPPEAASGIAADAPSHRNLARRIEALQAQVDSLYDLSDRLAREPELARDPLAPKREAVEAALDATAARLRALEQRLEDRRTLGRAPSPPRAPRPPRKPLSYNLVRIGDDIVVGNDEVVRGDIIVIGGSVRLEGGVEGDAIVIGGNLELGREAEIKGQAMAIGGRLEANPGAYVEGRTVSILFPLDLGGPGARGIELVLDVLKLGLLLLVAAMLVFLFPGRVAQARQCLDRTFVHCLGFGLLVLTAGTFAVGVSVILLSLTLVGIPVALLLAVATLLVLFVAVLAGSMLVGERLRGRMRWPARLPGPFWSLTLGLVLLLLPELLRDLLDLVNPEHRLGWWLGVASMLTWWTICSVGVGALVLTGFGRRAQDEAAA